MNIIGAPVSKKMTIKNNGLHYLTRPLRTQQKKESMIAFFSGANWS